MSIEETNKPKATTEVVKEFDELISFLDSIDPTCSAEEINKAIDRISELENQYNWFNVEFSDPTTGKKGLKSVSGEVIVPALFDGFCERQSYIHRNIYTLNTVIAIKDGKFGIVNNDGSGHVLCDFKYDSINRMDQLLLHIARWDGIKDRFGIIAANGDIICPNILTKYYEPFNDILIIESEKKLGVIDLDTYQCVLPEFDDLDADPDEYIVFHKDGQEWYITDTGERITKDQFENDERYADTYCLNTFI